MQIRLIGFFLLLAGLLLLLVETQWVAFSAFLTWPFALFIIGISLVFFSFIQKQSQLTLIGGIAATLGLTVWGFQYVETWPKHWSIIVGMLGIVLFLQYILNQNHLTLIVSISLLLSGFLAWPGLKKISFLAPVAEVMNVYWPTIIVGLGAIFIFSKSNGD